MDKFLSKIQSHPSLGNFVSRIDTSDEGRIQFRDRITKLIFAKLIEKIISNISEKDKEIIGSNFDINNLKNAKNLKIVMGIMKRYDINALVDDFLEKDIDIFLKELEEKTRQV